MIWISDSYLVHGEVSVVEVAAASLEANFSHAVVNQKEIPQLQETYNHANSPSNCSFVNELNVAATAHERDSHFSVAGQDPSWFRSEVDNWLAKMLSSRAGQLMNRLIYGFPDPSLSEASERNNSVRCHLHVRFNALLIAPQTRTDSGNRFRWHDIHMRAAMFVTKIVYAPTDASLGCVKKKKIKKLPFPVSKTECSSR